METLRPMHGDKDRGVSRSYVVEIATTILNLMLRLIVCVVSLNIATWLRYYLLAEMSKTLQVMLHFYLFVIIIIVNARLLRWPRTRWLSAHPISPYDTDEGRRVALAKLKASLTDRVLTIAALEEMQKRVDVSRDQSPEYGVYRDDRFQSTRVRIELEIDALRKQTDANKAESNKDVYQKFVAEIEQLQTVAKTSSR